MSKPARWALAVGLVVTLVGWSEPGYAAAPATAEPSVGEPVVDEVSAFGDLGTLSEADLGSLGVAAQTQAPEGADLGDPAVVDELTDRLSGLPGDRRTVCTEGSDAEVCARRYVSGDAAGDGGNTEPSPRAWSQEPLRAVTAEDWEPECTGTGTDGYRVYAIHAHVGTDQGDIDAARERIHTAMANADVAFDESAAATGGTRRIRWATEGTPGDCSPLLESVRITSGVASFDALLSELHDIINPDETEDEKFIIWTEGDLDPDEPNACGLGLNYTNTHAGSFDNWNSGRSFAAVKDPCWDLDGGGSVPAHELMHTLGAVQPSAPNADDAGHCTDDHDLMCYGPSTVVVPECDDIALEAVFDCNHDDYFHTDPSSGTYLCRFWNSARSPYLHGYDIGYEPLNVPSGTVSARADGLEVSWSAGPECPGPSAIGIDVPGVGTWLYPVTTSRVFVPAPPGNYNVEIAAIRDGEVRSRFRFASIPEPPNRRPVGEMVISLTDGRGYGMLGYAIDPDTGGPVRMRVTIPGVLSREYDWNYRWDHMSTYTGWNRTEALLFLAQLPPGTHQICLDGRDANTGQWIRFECRTHTVK